MPESSISISLYVYRDVDISYKRVSLLQPDYMTRNMIILEIITPKSLARREF
jgi:hypothetical protein